MLHVWTRVPPVGGGSNVDGVLCCAVGACLSVSKDLRSSCFLLQAKASAEVVYGVRKEDLQLCMVSSLPVGYYAGLMTLVNTCASVTGSVDFGTTAHVEYVRHLHLLRMSSTCCSPAHEPQLSKLNVSLKLRPHMWEPGQR